MATLLAGSRGVGGGHPERLVGLIVGTGTNLAGFFTLEQLEKLHGSSDVEGIEGPIAVNLESGGVHPPHLTRWDDEVDGAADHPGHQRFEKAVSGFYVPQVFRRVRPDLASRLGDGGARDLVELRDGPDGGEVAELAGAILARSADLIAAAISGLVDHYPGSGPVAVLAEGSFVWGDPRFADRVTATAGDLLGSSGAIRLERLDHANLVGSAVAALEG